MEIRAEYYTWDRNPGRRDSTQLKWHLKGGSTDPDLSQGSPDMVDCSC